MRGSPDRPAEASEGDGGAVEALRSSALYQGVIASRRLNYIYVQNWKCASSTVRSTLWAAEHRLGLAGPPENPHRPSPASPFVDDPARWEHADRTFVFTIVRNPFVRVLSAYLDKIKLHRDRKVWAPFARRHGLGDRVPDFAEFLRLVAGTPVDEMDPHWRPQSCTLLPGIIPYDHVGALETIERDLPAILTSIFPGGTAIRRHVRHVTESAEKLGAYFGPEQLRLARSIYERDFVELGYGDDLDDLARRTATRPARREPIMRWGRAWRLVHERRFADAELELIALRRWIKGAALEERLLRCRCRIGRWNSREIAESVDAVGADLARGRGDWSTWKWYGRGLLLSGRWEDGLRALLSAAERRPAAAGRGVQRARGGPSPPSRATSGRLPAAAGWNSYRSAGSVP